MLWTTHLDLSVLESFNSASLMGPILRSNAGSNIELASLSLSQGGSSVCPSALWQGAVLTPSWWEELVAVQLCCSLLPGQQAALLQVWGH